MNLLSRSASILAGLAGLAAFSALPANADSTFSGSSTFTVPNAYTQSVSAELTTTTGVINGFTTGVGAAVGSVTAPIAPSVNAEFQAFAPTGTAASGTLSLNAYIDTTANKTISEVVATQLEAIDPATSLTTLDQYTSIVKAAGGNDGLE